MAPDASDTLPLAEPTEVDHSAPMEVEHVPQRGEQEGHDGDADSLSRMTTLPLSPGAMDTLVVGASSYPLCRMNNKLTSTFNLSSS